ncbi:MAG TPA: peptide-methionine (R)-S-oxide reductase MsrB [Anaerohalosphaeraceae bacterium]|jgi:peptide-methionine (R)-S-oxide reductase|nr:peptide-methionine (R)-S-oxide reductase MsrB [Anaerohalosphaeraceae bacterium]HRT50260.1 peptide-methionine (R)-S-oxide reductase MsrB [Anaerohalosphaeraceae bacterium]HRT86219.1 peptide-methionine (R)-S-oxide reductase MsrB [Anaerohalosphaeraceae bacterium]
MGRKALAGAVVVAVGLVLAAGCDLKPTPQYVPEKVGNAVSRQEDVLMAKTEKVGKIVKSNDEWRKELTPEQYHIMREKGTERAFTGKYDEFFEDGVYLCAACGQKLFESDAKFNSGCGWPAFSKPADENSVEYAEDTSYGMTRTEVMCSRCGGHLGHVFNDGPRPTGMRYCINSAALDFRKPEKRE